MASGINGREGEWSSWRLLGEYWREKATAWPLGEYCSWLAPEGSGAPAKGPMDHAPDGPTNGALTPGDSASDASAPPNASVFILLYQ